MIKKRHQKIDTKELLHLLRQLQLIGYVVSSGTDAAGESCQLDTLSWCNTADLFLALLGNNLLWFLDCCTAGLIHIVYSIRWELAFIHDLVKVVEELLHCCSVESSSACHGSWFGCSDCQFVPSFETQIPVISSHLCLFPASRNIYIVCHCHLISHRSTLSNRHAVKPVGEGDHVFG